MNKIILVLKGMCMGAADVVPGVSGGTMALILGIYQQLINAIKSFDFLWFKAIFSFDFKTIFNRPHFAFLIPLMIGILAAVIVFTRIFPLPIYILLYPELVFGLFFGLILASIFVLVKQTKLTDIIHYVFITFGIAVGYFVFSMVPEETPNDTWFVFITGAIAICAMILPGISGSFLLLMLKKYSYILTAIGHFKLSIIIPFALGAATGLMLFSRVLSYLLSRYNKSTLAFIIGLLVASLWIIWPFQERHYATIRGKEKLIESVPYIPQYITLEVMQSLGMVLIGFILVITIDYLANRNA